MIDHNYHLDREVAVCEEGEVMVSRRFQQRTQKWTTRTVKEEKDYAYIAHLMARILRLRSVNSEEGMLAHVSLDIDDPRRIAPTIASVQPQASVELFAKHQSRFGKPKRSSV